MHSPLDDPDVAAAMIYCGPRGIPVSHFLGGPPGWDEFSREVAILWAIRERGFCPGCGTHPDEWDEDKGGDRDAFAADSRFCRGCELIASARKSAKDDPATHVHLIRRRLGGES